MHWKIVVALVSLFGVLKRFNPGGPFQAPFLLSAEFKNFTSEQVYGQIYPFSTYANVLTMLPIFFSVDFLRYKPILILEAFSYFFHWLLLAYGTTLFQMQLMQIFNGIAFSCSAGYSSYLYAITEKKYYKRVASYIHASTYLGRFLSYGLGQILITTNLCDYLFLNKLNLWASAAIIPIALILPFPKANKSTAEVREKGNKELILREQSHLLEQKKKENALEMGSCLFIEINEGNQENEEIQEKDICSTIMVQIKGKLAPHFKNPILRSWFLFTLLFMVGFYQIINYLQVFWARNQMNQGRAWNGLVESMGTLFCASSSFLVQFLHFQWERHSTLVFTSLSLLMATLLGSMVYFANIFVDYACSIGLYILTALVQTISSNIIAANLDSKAYGFIFGLNTFIGALIQTVFTVLVVDGNGLFTLSIEQQFAVYSAYFIGIAVLFGLIHLKKSSQLNNI